MTTIPRKQYKYQSSTDTIAVLAYMLAIGILLFYGTRPGAFQLAIGRTLGIQSGMSVLSAGSQISFAADAQYWDVNCSHGWTSDAACDTLVARTQACEISAASAYCSEYKTYLRQFLDK